MHFFQTKKNKLYAEEIPVERIAHEVGTPVYIYSYATLKRHFSVFNEAFASLPHLLCFSMKCNSNLAILKAISHQGGGADIVSGGELYRALQAGMDPQKIVYSGVGKTEAEIAQALQAGILLFNVESEEELELINRVAGGFNKKAPISLRVNPNIDPKTHPYISTGMKKSKFGMDVKKSLQIYQKAKKLPHLQVKGLDCHIGSQLTQVRPFIDALKKLKILIQKLRKMGIEIQYLDLGGGLGIRYKDETPPSVQMYAKAILEEVKNLNVTLIFEPGRVIMGNAGILLTRVLYHKKNPSKEFMVVDAAMNDLIRPAFYGSFHEIAPISSRKGKKRKIDIVGPICESGDFFAQNRLFPPAKTGDILSIFSAGAYGFAMSSNYNSRPRAAEVLVNGDQYHVIRERETLEDLVRGEKIPDFLK